MRRLENNDEIKIERPNEKLYDLGMIEQLCRGNQEQVKKMVKVFIGQIGHSLEELKLAYHSGDFTALRSTAHKIKPTLAYFGIGSIENTIRLIEVLAQEELSEELGQMIARVDATIGLVIDRMEKDFYC